MTTMISKRHVRHFAERSNQDLKQTEASNQSLKLFEENGFKIHHFGLDSRGGQHPLHYHVLRSPSGDIIATLAEGKSWNMKVDNIQLATRFEDGTWIKTINTILASEIDLTGISTEALYASHTPVDLLRRHRNRMERECRGRAILSYDEQSPLLDYFGDVKRKTDLLVSKGLARYRDDEKTIWSYTFFGSLKFMFWTTLQNLKREVIEDR
ncbi:MAG: hypothetical protein U0798_21355 [Gemmataceae bacterium]